MVLDDASRMNPDATPDQVAGSGFPESLPPAVDALIGRLRAHYPDMSRFTVVSMTGRGRDFLHHLIHTRLGGLLPTILSFDDYRTSRIARATGLAAVTEDEAFLRFHAIRRRNEGDSLPPADTQRLIAFLAAIAEFSVSAGELRALDRIGHDQLKRIDRFFAAIEEFREGLAAEGMFHAPFEAARFADLDPDDRDLFVGLPLMTPLNRSFFSRIPRDRLFVDAPLFGPHMPADPPEYETALSLVRSIGIAERRDRGDGLDFSELAERAALHALLAREIGDFLGRSRSRPEQLFVVPLDERLSFYLWELLFRPLGGQVNFAPWIPFTHFAAAQQLRDAVRGGKKPGMVRRDLVRELSAGWNELDEADRSAFEGAITLCDELERLRPLMGAGWQPITEYLIDAKKLHLHGNRGAPIQVVGMGDATGIPYHRAVILPMNSGIFPRKHFSGPYLNLIHLPRIHRIQFEADDLALRQFLAFGRTAHLVALYDQANGEAPSPHFSFLATEFGRKPVKRRITPMPFRVPSGTPAIENTDALRERLRQHTWSYSSLGVFFTCPYRFVLENIREVAAPPCFDEAERANLLIGNFLHRLFAELKDHHPAIVKWRDQFNERWDSDPDLLAGLPDHAVRKAIVQSYLADIAAWEQETGRRLLFSDEVTAAELELTAPFGNGRYRLRGRIDRLQRHGGRLLIADLKYKEKNGAAGRLADRVEKTDAFDERFQLLIYAYLALRNGTAEPDLLDASYLLLRPISRGDYEAPLSGQELADCDRTMERIAQRIDGMLEMERFTPNYRAKGCAFCPFKALCLKPDLYRTGGRPW